MHMMSRAIELLEVGPRDGLQMEPQVVSTAVKIALIERLLQAGVRRIEVASFVNPNKVPQMADAESLLSQLHRPDGVYFTGLVLNRRGLERAVAAGCNEIGMVVAASDSFNRRNQGVGTQDSIAAWLQIATAARAAGVRAQVTISTSFGCPFEGEVPIEHVLDIAQRLAGAEPFELCFADTIGVAVPSQVSELLARFHADGQKLNHEHVVEAIDDEPRQPVTLGVDEPAAVRLVARQPQSRARPEGLIDVRAKERTIDLRRCVAGEHAHRDRRSR